MAYFVTLMTPPYLEAFSDGLILKIKSLFAQDLIDTHILSDDEAVDFELKSEPSDQLKDQIKEVIGDLPIDVAYTSAENRQKKLLIADMDSTMILQECIDEIADFQGIKDQVSDITERAMNGELEFDGALKERVMLLKGMPMAALNEVFEKQITLTPGAKTLIQTMKSHGAFTALVSGGFTYFTEKVAEQVGFDVTRANTLIFDGDQLDGTVGMPILGQQAKLDSLNEFCADRDIELADAIAVGDGANDLSMIKAAGFGVAFHAKPIVAAQAKIAVNYCDLTALLFMQGIPKSEFSD